MRLALALLLVAAVARADVARPPRSTLVVSSRTLPNGLTVVVNADPSVSTVAIELRYELGPDDAAHAGYVHLVERLGALGSVHVKPGEFDRRIDDAGGFATSTADSDGLRFATQVPAGAFELALWLEAERMAGLADGITDAGLATARDAIDAEYRAAYVDQPYALVEREVAHALWGAGRDTLVDHVTLARAKRESVRAYVRDRLVPMNASLAITGRIDEAQGLALATKYFGWIPPGTRIVRSAPPVARLASPVEKTANDPNRRHVIAYRTNARGSVEELVVEVAARAIAQSLGGDVHVEVIHSSSGGEVRFVGASAFTARAIHDAAGTLTDDAITATSASMELELLVALEGLSFRADALATGMEYDARRKLLRQLAPDAVRGLASHWLAETSAVTVTGVP